jgi:hypothetical protein
MKQEAGDSDARADVARARLSRQSRRLPQGSACHHQRGITAESCDDLLDAAR